MPKRWIVEDEYDYFLSEHKWSNNPTTEDEEFIRRYDLYEAEKEYIQSKLHRFYTDFKEQELIKKTETGIPAHGF